MYVIASFSIRTSCYWTCSYQNFIFFPTQALEVGFVLSTIHTTLHVDRLKIVARYVKQGNSRAGIQVHVFDDQSISLSVLHGSVRHSQDIITTSYHRFT